MVTNEELDNYVRASLQRGASQIDIKNSLLARGWSEEEIVNSLNRVTNINYSPLVNTSGEEGNGNSKKFTIILVIAIAFIVVAIGAVAIFLVASEKESGLKSEAGGVRVESVKCKINTECPAQYECIENECIKTNLASKPPAQGTSSKSSSSSKAGSGGGSSSSTAASVASDPVVQIKDCGKDLNCFISASKNCELSKVQQVYATELFDLKKTTDMYYELKGTEADKCLFYFKTEKIDIQYTEKLIQEMIDSGISEEGVSQRENVENINADAAEGKNAVCKIKITDLPDVLNGWKDVPLNLGTFSDEVWKYAACEGSYFSRG